MYVAKHNYNDKIGNNPRYAAGHNIIYMKTLNTLNT